MESDPYTIWNPFVLVGYLMEQNAESVADGISLQPRRTSADREGKVRENEIGVRENGRACETRVI